MKTLRQNLNNAYIRAMNKLGGKHARRRIVVYVESYDDVNFWRQLLAPLETERTCFEVLLPSHTTLCKGKKTALANELGERLGQYMIACVDADYDWLMSGVTPVSRFVIENPYVFHTYAYAIENYQCYAPSLHSVCVMSTLNDKMPFDLEAFMSEYSAIIWPLFVWNVWAYRYGRFKEFCMSQFADTVSFHDINPMHPERTLEEVRRRVNRSIAMLHRRFPEGKKTYPPLREELLGKGLTPETTYLYMQGHTLFDNVVMPLLSPVCLMLRREREREITRLAMHQTQKQNELSGYQHSQAPVDEMLRKNTAFRNSAPYQLLREDISRFMSEFGRVK